MKWFIRLEHAELGVQASKMYNTKKEAKEAYNGLLKSWEACDVFDGYIINKYTDFFTVSKGNRQFVKVELFGG